MVSVPSSATSTSTLPASAAGTVTVRPPGTVSTLLPFTATSSRMASDLLPPAPVTVTDSAVNDTVLPLCFASSDRPSLGMVMPAMGVDTVRSRLSPAMSLTDDFGSSTVTLEASPSISGATTMVEMLPSSAACSSTCSTVSASTLAVASPLLFTEASGVMVMEPPPVSPTSSGISSTPAMVPPLMLLPCSSIHSTAALNFSTSAMVI